MHAPVRFAVGFALAFAALPARAASPENAFTRWNGEWHGHSSDGMRHTVVVKPSSEPGVVATLSWQKKPDDDAETPATARKPASTAHYLVLKQGSGYFLVSQDTNASAGAFALIEKSKLHFARLVTTTANGQTRETVEEVSFTQPRKGEMLVKTAMSAGYCWSTGHARQECGQASTASYKFRSTDD